jgi:beta-lactamase regulating signal transducer with metallopeptidase domain
MTSSIFAAGIFRTDTMVAGYLVDSSVKVSLLLMLTAAICLGLRRFSAATRHFAWVTTLSAALLLPVLTINLPQWQVLPNWLTFNETTSTSQVLAENSNLEIRRMPQQGVLGAAAVLDPLATWEPTVATRAADTPRADLPLASDPVNSPVNAPSRNFSLLERSALVLCGIWILGVLILTMRLAYGVWTLRILPGRLTPMTNAPLIEILHQTAWELRIAPPLLHSGARDVMPMVWGIIQSHLVLPSEAIAWPQERVRAVLLHELAHVRRRDPLTQLVGQLTLILHWFNPLAWWSVRQLRREQEQACDDVVLRAGVSASAYAAHVLDLATQVQPGTNATILALTMAQPIEIESRLQTILEAGRSRVPISLRFAALMFLGASGTAVGLSMAQAAPGSPTNKPSTESQSETSPKPVETSDQQTLSAVALATNESQTQSEAKDREPEKAKPESSPEKTDSSKSKPDPAPTTPAVSPMKTTKPRDDLEGGPVVLGLNLKNAPFKKDAKDLPDLYEPAPDKPGSLQQRRDVFEMPLDQHAWLKYPTSRGRYYIEYRDDREKPETERTYGPIEGDPLAFFKLVESFTTRLMQEDLNFDDFYRIQLMLRTDNSKMAKTAAQLMLVALDSGISLNTMEHRINALRGILNDFAETFKKHELTKDVEQLNAKIAFLAKEIDRLTMEIPDSEYLHAVPGKDPIQIPEKISKDAWGPDTRGLRLAIVPNPDATVKHGEPINFTLVVENVSDHDIKFGAHDITQQARAEARQSNDRDQVKTSSTWFTGISPILHYLLKPKEKIAIASASIVALEKEDNNNHKIGQTQLIAGTGIYLVRYNISFGMGSSWKREPDGILWKAYPAKGEWVGSLQSGPIAIQSRSGDKKTP